MNIAPDAPLFYRIMQRVFWLIFRLLTRIEVAGLENIPTAGPMIIAPNHLQLFDPVIIFAIIPHQMTVFAADKWRGTLGGLVLNVLGDAIYVARGEPDREALGKALAVLKGGGALGVAPEGTRSRVHSLLQGKNGTVYLASRSGATIVPMAQWGQEEIFEAWLHFRRPEIHVRIGPPMQLPAAALRAKTSELQTYTDDLMVRIARMMPEQYWGVYAERAREYRGEDAHR